MSGTTASLSVACDSFSGHSWLAVSVQLSDATARWQGLQLDYTLAGASVDTSAAKQYSFIATDSLLGQGNGIYTDMTDADLSSVTAAHNAGSSIAFALQGTAHAVGVPDGWTCFVYVRRGKVDMGGGQPVGQFETAYFSRRGGDAVRLTALTAGADVMVFAGEPIGAPVVASGTMVMNTQNEVNQAVRDYQSGQFGIPWDHALPDEEWAAATGGGQRRTLEP